MNCDILKIVRGNDFATQMTITALDAGGNVIEDFSLEDSTDVVVKYTLAGELHTIEAYDYDIEGNDITIQWSDLALGKYGFEIEGKFNGYSWRSAARFIFQIVADNASANIPDGVLLNGIYILNDWLRLLSGTGGGIKQVQADWDETDTNSPAYIQNKPDLNNYATDTELQQGLATKQDTLISGENIKTINGESILGEGNVEVGGDVESVNGKTGVVVLDAEDVGAAPQSTTYTKTEVDAALAAKQNTLVSGTNIATINGSDITQGGNVSIVAVEGQTITIDATPTKGSNNAVSSNGTRKAIDDATVYSTKEEVNILSGVETTNNYFIQYSNGQDASSNGYKYSDYISVNEGDVLTLANFFAVPAVAILSAYDSSKVYKKSNSIAGNSGTYGGTYTVPSGVSYIRASWNAVYTPTIKKTETTITGNVKDSIASLEESVLELENNLNVDKIDTFNNILTEYQELVISDNTFIWYSDGQTDTSNGYKTTDFISLVSGGKIKYKLYGANIAAGLAFYNSSKQYLKSISKNYINNTFIEDEIDVPNEAVYLRISWYSSQSGQYVAMKAITGQIGVEQAFNLLYAQADELGEEIEDLNSRVDENIVYTAFGDSISTDEIMGDSATIPNSHADGLAYPRTLARLINATLDRYTISGTGVTQLKQNVLLSNANAKLVTIMYGINNVANIEGGTMQMGDLQTVMSESMEDLANDSTFLGIYRWSIKTLRSRLIDENALICCISPCTNYIYDNPNGSRPSQTLIDMRENIRQLIIEEGGPNAGWFYIDGKEILPWDNMYFVGTNGTADSTHPNTMGEAIMAHEIFNRLPNILLYTTRK